MNLESINEYCLKKHCVLPNTQVNSIEEVSRKHVGLHSARIMTPFMTLCSRMNCFEPKQLISQLYTEKKLIKLRCMRTTLHIVPVDMASMFHMSTLDIRLADCKLFFKRNNISNKTIDSFEDLFKKNLTVPKAPEELENEIRKEIHFGNESFKKEFSKKILKYYWECGTLCYINSAEYWENEERKYAITQRYYPDINFERYDITTAKEMLILEYIKRFGPATVRDMIWWSGLNGADVKKILENNINLLRKIEINNFVFYMLESEYENLLEHSFETEDWVALLAYEDPALKGYFESRSRYVNNKNYNLLFNQIGEVRASILHNGKAIGIWEWDKKNKNIVLKYFDTVPKRIKDRVEEAKQRYEIMLFPTRQMNIWNI